MDNSTRLLGFGDGSAEIPWDGWTLKQEAAPVGVFPLRNDLRQPGRPLEWRISASENPDKPSLKRGTEFQKAAKPCKDRWRHQRKRELIGFGL